VLTIDGQRVEVSTEDGQLVVVVVCASCRQGRPWLPGLEAKGRLGVV
jgi:hypothetical protein